jgi:hypothetical protein
MATRTWNLRQINVGGTGPNRLWWDRDTAAAAATSSTGWTVAKTAANNYRLLNAGLESAGFSTTIAPNNTAPVVDNNYPSTAIFTPPTLLSDVESISTLYEYNGVFPAGNWVFNFPVIAVTSGGDQDGAITMRVFKGTRNGTAWSGVTELTSAMLQGTTVTNLTTAAAQTSTVTWAAPIVQLNNEFLICKIGWRITGAGGATNRDVLLRFGTGANMTSTNFRKRSYNIN